MPLVPLKFKPGIVKDLSEYSSGKNGPFYTDSNLVRFRNGYPTKIGGWEQETYFLGTSTSTVGTVQGSPRKMLAWRGITDGSDYIAVGTHSHVYVIKDSIAYDITPLRKTTANMTNPLVVTNGSATVTVTDNSHGASTGDYIVIEQATATGGITAATLNDINGYEITKVDANSYTFVAGSAATSGATGGGTAIDINYLIGNAENVGNQSSDPALGWGVGTWGESTWGTPRDGTSTTVSLESTNWTLVLWGEDLLLNNVGGQIYYWDLSDSGISTRAALVSAESGASDVPSSNKTITVSFPDRHLIAGGCSPLGATTADPMLVRFSNQEDFVTFTPTATNTSGDQRLEVGTKIVSMIPTKDETFIQTDEAAYGMTFVGPPFTFSFRLLAVNCGAVSLHGSANVDGDVYWIGQSNFFVYNGAVQELPCSVQHFVFDRLQSNFSDKTFVGHNKKFNEITWFYVSTDNEVSGTNPEPEPDSYVSFNYADAAWTIGTLQRNAWSDATNVRKVPFALDKDGKLYNHETGTSDNGSAMSAFIESGDVELDSTGENLFMVDKIIPDATMTTDTSLSVQIKTRKYPNATEITKGSFTVTSTTEKVSTRAKGRQMAIKFSSSGTADDWSLGDFRINARKDGLR
tara:strand:- start:2030 stop:3928 length:1899 start_codon:yes stop_codon:yes gene_type:complete